jgi:hypothetical protein
LIEIINLIGRRLIKNKKLLTIVEQDHCHPVPSRACTMLLLASALFIGVALGLRHNVFILVPACIVSAGTTLVVSIAGHDSFWTIVVVTTSTLAALQMGYLAGAIVLPLAGKPQDVVSAPDKPIEHAYERADVVHFHKYRLAKTR